MFDSGVGGLSVLRAAREALPQENFIYFADSGFAPYGDKSDAYVIERSERIGAWFVAQGATAIVVACNTATAIAVQTLRAKFDLPIVGVEPGLKPAVAATKSGKIAVFATAATLASRRYADLLARIQFDSSGVEFIPAIGVGWVDLVEQGDLNSSRAVQIVVRTVQPLRARGCDTFVLGCTHYPFLAPAIQQAAPDAVIIDTAPAIAREVARRVAISDASSAPIGRVSIFSSGELATVNRAVSAMVADDFAIASIQSALP